jgi:hypothetical protein
MWSRILRHRVGLALVESSRRKAEMRETDAREFRDARHGGKLERITG